MNEIRNGIKEKKTEMEKCGKRKIDRGREREDDGTVPTMDSQSRARERERERGGGGQRASRH